MVFNAPTGVQKEHDIKITTIVILHQEVFPLHQQ